MAKSSAKGSASSTATRKDKESHIVSKYLILPIIAAVVTSVIVGNLSSPSIQASAVHDFLKGYYQNVTQADKRSALYRNDLTSNFRGYPGVDWSSYNAFWKKWKRASVDSVTPVPGNALEFAVILTYQPKHSNSFENNLNFWFVCTGIGNLLAHVPFGGCPSGHIKIDNEQLATQHQ
jgi:hypothetical protein